MINIIKIGTELRVLRSRVKVIDLLNTGHMPGIGQKAGISCPPGAYSPLQETNNSKTTSPVLLTEASTMY